MQEKHNDFQYSTTRITHDARLRRILRIGFKEKLALEAKGVERVKQKQASLDANP